MHQCKILFVSNGNNVSQKQRPHIAQINIIHSIILVRCAVACWMVKLCTLYTFTCSFTILDTRIPLAGIFLFEIQWAKVISNKTRSRAKCTAVTITQCKRKSKLISHVESHLGIGASNWFALELRVEGPFILNKHSKHRTIAPFFLSLFLIWFDLSHWILFGCRAIECYKEKQSKIFLERNCSA